MKESDTIYKIEKYKIIPPLVSYPFKKDHLGSGTA